MKKSFLIVTGTMFGLLAGLLFDILHQLRDISFLEDALFRAVILVLFTLYYFTGQSQ